MITRDIILKILVFHYKSISSRKFFVWMLGDLKESLDLSQTYVSTWN